MHKLFLGIAIAVAVAFATPAAAGPASVAVSSRGVNSAGCGAVANPCRTLQFAHNLVDPGGKIDILDSGEYGSLFVNKSVDVVYAGSGVALLRAAGAGKNAVIVSAGASDVVRLRGLIIDGGGAAANGIVLMGGARLEIADSAIRDAAGQGVNVASPNSSFSIRNASISNSGYGLRARPSSGSLTGEIDGLRLLGNSQGGLFVGDGADVVVSNSVAMTHRGAAPGVGFQAVGAGARLTLRETTVFDDRLGVSASGSGVVRLSNSTIVGNDVAAAKSAGGVVETFGDNVIRGNANDALGALTPAALR